MFFSSLHQQSLGVWRWQWLWGQLGWGQLRGIGVQVVSPRVRYQRLHLSASREAVWRHRRLSGWFRWETLWWEYSGKTQKAQHLFNVMLWFNLQFNIQNTFLDKRQPFHFISCLQTCVRWAMGVVVTTAALFLGKASCVLVRWAWSWELTTRPATSRAFAPNISSVARSVNRRNLVSSAPAMRAGSWSLTWRAAKAPVSPPTPPPKKQGLLSCRDFCLTLL